MRWKVALLTVSDKGARGEREDTSAQVIREIVDEELQGEIIEYRVVPDEEDEIMAALIEMVDYHKADLIITTGGIGLGPRDITPEATRKVIEREATGLAEAMRSSALVNNRNAMLTRAVAGMRNRTLIINLPGKPKGVSDSLTAIIDQLPLALHMVSGKTN